MRHLAKRKRRERAHRYRVLAQQLDFHLSTDTMGEDVDGLVRSAKHALLQAADVLEKSITEAVAETTTSGK